MLLLSSYAAISFSASLEINTPELNEYLYSRQTGKVVKVYVEQNDTVKNESPLMLFFSGGSEKFIYSSVNGKVTYLSELNKGSLFQPGKLLFKIKSDESYGILELTESSVFPPALAIGSSLCSETYNSPLKVIKVNENTIQVSIKVGAIELLKSVNKGNTHNFQICDE